MNTLGRERTVLLSTHVMQEVEATCSRLVILSRGRLAAKGSVSDLLARLTGGVRYVVEAAGDGVAAALAGLSGVQHHATDESEGRTRVRLDAAGDEDLRPRIFELAKERGWTLWELHREKANLEQVFRNLTSNAAIEAREAEEAAEAAGPDEVPEPAGMPEDAEPEAPVADPEADR